MRKFTLLLMFTGILFGADNNGTIYTWGYIDFIYNILLAIQSLISGGTSYFIKVAGSIGFLIVAIKIIGNPNSHLGYELGRFLMLYLVVLFLFFTAGSTSINKYVIEDKKTNEVRVVQGVPVGIGSTFSILSTSFDYILKAYDTFFSTPNSISYRNAGFGFPLITQIEAGSTRVTNVYLEKTFNEYFYNCIVPDISNGNNDMSLIKMSNNLLDQLKSESSRITILYTTSNGSNGVETTCKSVYNNIIARFNAELDVQISILSNNLNVPKETLLNKTGNISSLFFDANTDARTYLQQNFLSNMTNNAIKYISVMNGTSQGSNAYAYSIAQQNQKNSYAFGGLLAKEYIPVIQGALFAIVAGLSWFIALLSLAFGAFNHIKMFFTLVLWIVTWNVILALSNFLVDIHVASSFNTLYDVTGQKITIYTKDIIDEKVSTSLNWLGYFSIFAAVLALAIVKVSEYGFIQVASSLGSAIGASANAGARKSDEMSESTKPSIRVGDEIKSNGPGNSINTESMKTAFANGKTFAYESQTTQVGDTKFTNTKFDDGSRLSQDAKGNATSVNLSNSTASKLSSDTQRSQQGYKETVSDVVGTSIASEDTFTNAQKTALTENEKQGLQSASTNAFEKTAMQNENFSKMYNEMQKIMGQAGVKISGGIPFIAEGEAGVQYSLNGTDGNTYTATDTSTDANKNAKTFSDNYSKEISKNKESSNGLSKILKNSDTHAYNKLKASSEDYAQIQQSSLAIKIDEEYILNLGKELINSKIDKELEYLNTDQNKINFANYVGNFLLDISRNNKLNKILKKLDDGNNTRLENIVEGWLVKMYFNKLKTGIDINSELLITGLITQFKIEKKRDRYNFTRKLKEIINTKKSLMRGKLFRIRKNKYIIELQEKHPDYDVEKIFSYLSIENKVKLKKDDVMIVNKLLQIIDSSKKIEN